jgi:NADPH:quinone reductase-like Zn-dependent oxidoreductase
MQANGKQLSEIGKLIEAGVIRPIIDKVFHLNKQTKLCLMLQVVVPEAKLSSSNRLICVK